MKSKYRFLPVVSVTIVVFASSCVSPAARDHYDVAAQLTQQSREASALSQACAQKQDLDCVEYWAGIARHAQLRAQHHYRVGQDIQKAMVQAPHPQQPSTVTMTSKQRSTAPHG